MAIYDAMQYVRSDVSTVCLGMGMSAAELDEAMRVTSETLSQVTNLLAIVTAPPIETSTIRHVEMLALQPQVLMVVVITSTGGVSKRVIAYDDAVDPGLVNWAGSYLNDVLVGLDDGDDAAAVLVGEHAILSTADFFTPVVDDAYDWGRIAAANALFTGNIVWLVAPIVATVLLFLGLFLTSTGFNAAFASRRGVA